MGPLLTLGLQRPLEQEDLGDIGPKDQAAVLGEELLQRLQQRVPGRTPQLHLWMSLSAMQKRNIWWGTVGKEVGDLLGFVSPLALQGIVKFVTLKQAGGRDQAMGGLELGYWWVVAVFVSTLLQTVALHHSYQCFIRAGIQSRQAVAFAVYHKTLRIAGSQRQETGAGKIQNLLSVDSGAIERSFYYPNYAWAAVVQVGIAMAMLYAQLGAACFVGLGVLIALIPAQGILGTMTGAVTKRTMLHTDRRVKAITEIVTGVRLIKFFGWENAFAQRVHDIRTQELVEKRKAALINSFNTMLNNVGPMLVALLSFLTYAFVSDEPLTASKAFSSLALFSILRIPLMVLPMLVSTLAAGIVSARRVADFLQLPDMPETRTFVDGPPAAAEVPSSAPGTAADVAVSLVNATLSWQQPQQQQAAPAPAAQAAASGATAVPTTATIINPMHAGNNGAPAAPALTTASASATPITTAFRLRDVTVDFPAGQLTTIVGPVGSGKTSLLCAILGELSGESGGINIYRQAMPRTSPGAGNEDASHAIAYCAQQPWIMNATVKQNILFGLPLDEGRYRETLHACALTHDLAVLPAGDATEIGERGVNLSGGQKARISLARAVYSRCAVVLLDDVLSAVDAHVAAHIFKHAIRGALRGRTVIFVSHQLQFAPQSDVVLVLNQGRVEACGSFEAVLSGAAAGDGPRNMEEQQPGADGGPAAEEAAAPRNRRPPRSRSAAVLRGWLPAWCCLRAALRYPSLGSSLRWPPPCSAGCLR